MTDYPCLAHIDIAALITAAGGNPWHIDDSLQCGDAASISDLSRAFIAAGACTAQTYREFEQAQTRFRASWNHRNGENPINDSVEVQRATTDLMVQRDHLPAIGAVLSGIAADLAEAQRFSGSTIRTLNGQLEYIDALVGQALIHDHDIADLENSSVTITSDTLSHVESLRADYSANLASATTELRFSHGYDISVPENDPHANEAIEGYRERQRAADDAVSTQDSGAAARLRDYAMATNPAATPEARRLAEERLADFRMAAFVGPLPNDPVLGGDARTRARGRLQIQRRLEQGAYDLPSMTPDQATQTLDDGERFGRVLATRRVLDSLVSQGLSTIGASDVVSRMTTYGGPAMAGAEKTLSASDAKAYAKIANRVGKVGDLVEFGMAINDWSSGGSNEDLGGSAGAIVGGTAGAWAAGALAATVAGPWTAGAVAIVGDLVGSGIGERLGAGLGSMLDPSRVTGAGGRTW